MRFLLTVVFAVLLAASASAQGQAVSDAQKEEARSHFELGLSHFDREEWQAALVEFLKSRELFPSRGNTKDAAICLRKVGRFDEALDMYETLLRDFPDLSAADKSLAQREVAELQASVGTIALDGAPQGATVTIDGIDRGKAPLPKPVRLSAGTHMVRVTQEGALPFEQRVDLAGRQAAVVHVQLAELTQAGRLKVVEHAGKTLDVVVDGSVVGKTPFEGALAPGPHTVLLKSDENVGTPPTPVTVQLNQVATLDLVGEALGAALRVDIKPANANVSIDGVPVGRGGWTGRLRAGEHKIDATLDGYSPLSRTVNITDGATETLALALDAIVLSSGRRGITIEIDLGPTLGVVNTPDLTSVAMVCSGCSSSFPLGVEGVLHGTYELTNGLGFGIHAGYMLLGMSVDNRMTIINSAGSLVAHGVAHDGLLVNGFIGGIDGQYRTRGAWPLTLRIGVGVLMGAVRDHRTGTFNAQQGGSFAVDTTQAPFAGYLDVAPEVRIGRKLGDHVEINVGLTAHILASVASVPRWPKDTTVTTGSDGEGNFGNDTLAGYVMLVLVPGIGVKYDF